MSLKAIVRKNQYQDSVRLMSISRAASALAGVGKVLALLGTDSNKKVLADLGLLDEGLAAATANDLLICIEADSEEACDKALSEVDGLLKSSAAATNEVSSFRPKLLEQAADALPEATFAMISVPGQFAKLDVVAALERGLNVMLFSDNIPIEDEVFLKTRAVSKGLLMMGPDCGTAIINGVPFALANVIRRGSIGLIGASGTGLQEVACLIDSLGGGITHAIGVGGRDLRKAVGGIMMRQAIRMLGQDPATKSLVLISKPGDPDVMRMILDEARAAGLPTVTCLLGGKKPAPEPGIDFVGTLEAAAFAAMGLTPPSLELPPALREEAQRLSPERTYLRGLFSGGTLAYEALILLDQHMDIESNIAMRKELKLDYPAKGLKHCCVDLGEDEFTRGRPHPMIDSSLRVERLLEDLGNPAVKVILLDVVIGYGANRDPAGDLVAALGKGRVAADGGPVVLGHVCGTEADPQSLSAQEAKLREAGVYVFPTNAQAARAALAVIKGTF